MADNRKGSNLDVSHVLVNLRLGRQVLKLVCSMLLGAALASLGLGESHAQEEQPNCCKLDENSCFTFFGPNPEECEVAGGDPIPGEECFLGFICISSPPQCGREDDSCGELGDLPCCEDEGFRCIEGQCTSSTAVELVSFTAEVHADGTVTLMWETATEVDNVGFNLYRGKALGVSYAKINDALIPAEGDALSGTRYNFTDRPGYGIFSYKLEDVDYLGMRTVHRPIKVQVKPPWLPNRLRR